MKLKVLVALGVMALAALVVLGCRPEAEEPKDTCVSCHADREVLKATASEVKEVKSEETSGEG